MLWNRKKLRTSVQKVLIRDILYIGNGRLSRKKWVPKSEFDLDESICRPRLEPETRLLCLATGEAAGSLHGLNRMGGNALSKCIVFGTRGRRAAARQAYQIHSGPDKKMFATLETAIPVIKSKAGPDSPTDLKAKLRLIMWQYGGILRHEAGLTEGLNQLDQLEKKAQNLSPGDSARELTRILELQLGLTAAKIILKAALKREESPCAHYRTDFPDMKENWVGRQIVTLSPTAVSVGPLKADEKDSPNCQQGKIGMASSTLSH